MRFIDLTSQKKEWVSLNTQGLQAVVRGKTGRTLTFEDPKYACDYNDLFSLVYFGEVLGFAVVARTAIAKGTVLFPYGGRALASEENSSAEKTAYLLTTERPDGAVQKYQAEREGDLGSLVVHLPDHDFLTQFGISDSDKPKIQTSNAEVVLMPNGKTGKKAQFRPYLVATDVILPGSFIGFNYGCSYWLESGASPLLFKSGKTDVLDLKQLSFEGLAAFREKATGSCKLSDARTGLPSDTLAAVDMSYLIQTFSDDPLKTWAVFMGVSFMVSVAREDFEHRKAQALTSEGRPKRLITFFDATSVVPDVALEGKDVVDNTQASAPA